MAMPEKNTLRKTKIIYREIDTMRVKNKLITCNCTKKKFLPCDKMGFLAG